MKSYRIIDNFLKKNHFEKLSSLDLKHTNNDQLSIYKNKIDKTLNVNSDILNEELILDLHNSYYDIALNVLEELAPKKVELIDYSEFTIIETGKKIIHFLFTEIFRQNF